MREATVNDLDYWSRADHSPQYAGGQGTGHLAKGRNGELAFFKQLKRKKHRVSRGRFAREAFAYATIPPSPNLPRLYGHNADHWRDAETPLFIATEHIEGPTLRALVESGGVVDFKSSLSMTISLAKTLGHCHANDVVHRDVKPENVIFSSLSNEPVVVDFGLSFNNPSEDSPLTRVNEEVGNRFLRLPEHSTGGRSPISDLTQCAGILFFLLTGREPRVLVDERGEGPHQRPEPRSTIEGVTAGAQVERLLAFFDRAFDTRMTARFPTAEYLVGALMGIDQEDASSGDYAALLKTFREAASRPDVADAAQASRDLALATGRAMAVARELATTNGLAYSQGGGPNNFTARPPNALLRLALVPSGVIPEHFAQYRFDRVGPSDYQVVADDGALLWRGRDLGSDSFRKAIEGPIVGLFTDRSATGDTY